MTKGMQEDELREAAECARCGQPFGHAGPLFWRVRLTRYGLNQRAISRQDGLTAMLGGEAALARIMGANEVMATELSSREVTICEACAGEPVTVYGLE